MHKIIPCGCGLRIDQCQSCRSRGIHHGIEIDVVTRIQGQRVGAPVDGIIHIDIAAARCGAAAGKDGDIASRQIGAEGSARDVAAAGGNGVVLRVNQPCAAVAVCCLGGDFRAIGYLHMRGAGLDKAAVTRIGGGGIQRTCHLRGSSCHAAQQHDFAVLLLHGLRLNHAIIVDHAGKQRVACARAHRYQPAVSLNQTVVSNQRIQHAFIHLNLQEVVTIKGERYLIATAHRHRAKFGGDDTVVAYMVAK